MIKEIQKDHTDLPAGKVIMSGYSAGGSMAFRFMCERSEMIAGLVI